MKGLLFSQIIPLTSIGIMFFFNFKLELENKKLKEAIDFYKIQLKIEKNLYKLCDSERNNLK